MVVEPDNTSDAPARSATWTFITNHAGALLVLAERPDIRLTELADALEITERATLRIIRDLEAAGYVDVVKQGRTNTYRLHPERTMRHPIVRAVEIRQLLGILDAEQ